MLDVGEISAIDLYTKSTRLTILRCLLELLVEHVAHLVLS